MNPQGDSVITNKDLHQIRGRFVNGNINYFQNKYLIFKVSDLTKHQVWKQSLGFKKDRTYSFKVKVKPLVDNIPRSTDQFSIRIGNQEKTLGFKKMEGQWKVLIAYFTVSNVSTSQVMRNLKRNLHSQIYDIKNRTVINLLVIKPQSCKQMECCPPIMPDLPDNTVENPCKQQKEVITKANTDREFEEFLNDTLTDIKHHPNSL
ncbi:MAG: hypothetical protein U5L09_15130 [Bacteroidales bacterium]|nr:hypothetical protein [Bacteroidales bacterium]